jgi:hypothetical protein
VHHRRCTGQLRGSAPPPRGTSSPCQYRLFIDGLTVTFCEGDYVLGGAVNLVEYVNAGLTRAQGIEELDRLGQRVWLDGVEQPLAATAVKDIIHPRFGHIVYQHFAFIAQLTPGHHVSYFEGSTDGVVDLTATVYLDVLPRTDAACS